MTAIPQKTVLSHAEIEDLAFRALTAHGASDVAGRSLAKAVAAAESEGIASHGLIYVPIYCEHLTCGKVDPDALPQLECTGPSALRVDARNGFAHPAIDLAFESLVPTAHEQGVAAVSIHNSYNCGVLGYHVERLAGQGLLALGFTNSPASIAPVGSTRAVIGTNPFAFAVPGDEGSSRLLVDQSASVVAKSELGMRMRAGEPIPEGWALDQQGRPTTDPAVGLKGTMVPSGGYKGFGVGLLVEVLAAALSGAKLGIHAGAFSGMDGGPPGTGQFFIALSPRHFSGATFGQRIEDLVAAIDSQEGARVPGARRAMHRARAMQVGITVPLSLIDALKRLAEQKRL